MVPIIITTYLKQIVDNSAVDALFYSS